MNMKSLGGYKTNSKLIYEEGNNKLYQNGIYTAAAKSLHIINAKCSVVTKPNKTSDSVTLDILVNGDIRATKDTKTGSTDFSEYPAEIFEIMQLNYGDKVEIYCRTKTEGYISTDINKNILTILELR